MTKILTLTTITAKQMLTADASARAAACNGGGCGCDPCVDPSTLLVALLAAETETKSTAADI